MPQDNLIEFKAPQSSDSFSDSLTELLRQGARQIITQAVEVELIEFLDQHQALRTESGHQGVVRNGYLPKRSITTGVGEVLVQVPKVRDRPGNGIKFNSLLLPPYLKRSRSVEGVLPWLYLKGLSTGDFSEALYALLGTETKGLSAATISRLQSKWYQEHQHWQERSLRHKRYVYLGADGIYFNIRNAESQCILVLIGVSDTGHKEVLAIESGYRESALSWKAVLLKLQNQGLQHDPQLAIGDGALGFWKALAEVFPDTKHQRCWVHKTANVLNKLPKKQQQQAKAGLWEIYRANTKANATDAFNRFINTYQAKYPEATECLAKDINVLLAFYDFPAERWKHMRSTNPIESTFATVRLRTDKTRGAVSKATIIPLGFKLIERAQKRWLRIRGFKRLADVIEGVQFKDGVTVEENTDFIDHKKVA